MNSSRVEQHYVNDILSRRVRSADGSPVGRVRDLIVDLDRPQPEVTYIVMRRRLSRDRFLVPWKSVHSLLSTGLVLKYDADKPISLSEGALHPQEIYLRDFLLDKQIVDVHGAKVERVNDLLFLLADERLRLVQVDVGFRGILRRLGFEDAIVRFCEWFFDHTLKQRFIAWHYVQPLADPDRLRLQVAHSNLKDLHPADLADIIEDMDAQERAAVVESLNEELVADALEEMDPKVQVAIVRGLQPEKAADIIEEMSLDEAADLIADLPTDTVNGIFREMDNEYQEAVKELLSHEEDEAGGLMSTHFMALPPDRTIVDALAYIRQNAHDMDVIYYIYVIDDESRLIGVINLRELLSTEIFTPLERIMTRRVITAKLDDEAEDIADLFGKYGFRAVPVVDEENRIKGVIRFKALLEILAPHLGK